MSGFLPQQGTNTNDAVDNIHAQLNQLIAGEQAPQEQAPQTNVNDEMVRALLDVQRQNQALQYQQAQQTAWQQQSQYQQAIAQQRAMDSMQLQQQALQYASAFTPKLAHNEVPQEVASQLEGVKPVIDNYINDALGKYHENMQSALVDIYSRNLELERKLQQQPVVQGIPFEERLAIAKPNLPQITNDPQFHEFLDTPVSAGWTRKDLMSQAYRANDTQRVLAMLNEFEQQRGASQQPNVQPYGTVNSMPNQTAPSRARPISDLHKAQSQYRMGMLSAEKLDEIHTAFATLEAQGLVDYTR